MRGGKAVGDAVGGFGVKIETIAVQPAQTPPLRTPGRGDTGGERDPAEAMGGPSDQRDGGPLGKAGVACCIVGKGLARPVASPVFYRGAMVPLFFSLLQQ